MDEFLEHMLSIPSWSDTEGLARNHLVYNANGLVPANGLNIEQMGASKIFKASGLEHSNVINHSDLAVQGKDKGEEDAQVSGHLRFSLGDRVSAAYSGQREMKGSVLAMQDEAVPQSGLFSMHMLAKEVPSGGLKSELDLSGYQPLESRGSERSACQQVTADCHSSPEVNATWCQPYNRVVSPFPLSLGQPKSEAFLAREEAPQDGDGVVLRDICTDNPVQIQDGSKGRLFPGYGTTQRLNEKIGQPTNQQVAVTQSQGQTRDSNQGPLVHEYGSQSAASQPQSTNHHVTQNARPRVRARRGQATDPHSIAERLRRERIAERMKALQELVPNANKTDKASMLDEIIDYVKFLQLQVKVLSMSRLGGAGAISPLVADIHAEGQHHMSSTLLGPTNGPTQDGVTHTEREVAQLMEQDMGSAMQYLQSKGLCLMPISLATAMSCTTTKPVAGTQTHVGGVDSEGKTSVALVPISTSLTSISMVPPSASGDSDGGTISKGIGSALSDTKESMTGHTNATDVPPSLRSPKGAVKGNQV